MITAQAALEELKAGNARFVSGASKKLQQPNEKVKSEELLDGQSPFAIILGCSDSRAAAELIFDQGLGDLFVIRIAGNIAASSQIGSAEFAVQAFGTPLIVVLGHTNCGAVQATLQALKDPSSKHSPHLQTIVDGIKPALQPLLESDKSGDELLEAGVHANIQAAVNDLKAKSSVLSEAVEGGKVMIVGAEYSLKTGKVQFF